MIIFGIGYLIILLIILEGKIAVRLEIRASHFGKIEEISIDMKHRACLRINKEWIDMRGYIGLGDDAEVGDSISKEKNSNTLNLYKFRDDKIINRQFIIE